MKTIAARVTTLWNVFINCTIALIVCIFLVSYLNPIQPATANMQIAWVSPGKGFRVVRFVPNLDLAPQFVFNTKQIFLYAVAKSNGKEEIMWSKIVKNGDVYKFYDVIQSNYKIEPNGKIREYELRGSVFPYTGQVFDVLYGKLQQ